jgi:hypothetical protein
MKPLTPIFPDQPIACKDMEHCQPDLEHAFERLTQKIERLQRERVVFMAARPIVARHGSAAEGVSAPPEPVFGQSAPTRDVGRSLRHERTQRSLTHKLINILEAHDQAMTTAEIHSAYEARHGAIPPKSISRRLSRLATVGRVVRIGYSLYAHPRTAERVGGTGQNPSPAP